MYSSAITCSLLLLLLLLLLHKIQLQTICMFSLQSFVRLFVYGICVGVFVIAHRLLVFQFSLYSSSCSPLPEALLRHDDLDSHCQCQRRYRVCSLNSVAWLNGDEGTADADDDDDDDGVGGVSSGASVGEV